MIDLESFKQADLICPVTVSAWGSVIGYLAWSKRRQCALFEYAQSHGEMRYQLSPFAMPRVPKHIYRPALPCHLVPPLFTDSLPGPFARYLVDSELLRRSPPQDRITPLDRLAWIGSRTTGVFEFSSSAFPQSAAQPALLDLPDLIGGYKAVASGDSPANDHLRDLVLFAGCGVTSDLPAFMVSTDESSSKVFIDQDVAIENQAHWLLSPSLSASSSETKSLQVAYSKLAEAAGIRIAKQRLIKVDGLSHSFTQRIDRDDAGNRVHLQSLSAIGRSRVSSSNLDTLKEHFGLLRSLRAVRADQLQLFRQILFAWAIQASPDSSQSIMVTLAKNGQWALAPANDFEDFAEYVASNAEPYAWQRQGFPELSYPQLIQLGREQIPRFKPEGVFDEVKSAMSQWHHIAEACGVPERLADAARKRFRAT
ncbi:MAG: HipA domain-containing protein [Halopseudomonas sabulinigri]